jgi:hypothetical protein
MSTLAILDRSVQKTNVWLRDVNCELSWFTFQRGYLALRAVLHAVRRMNCATCGREVRKLHEEKHRLNGISVQSVFFDTKIHQNAR